MEGETFRPPGEPEFSAPTAHTRPPDAGHVIPEEEYEHPMAMKDAEKAEAEKKQKLVDRVREKLGMQKKPKEKPGEEKAA